MSFPEIRSHQGVELMSILLLLARAEERFAYFFAHDTPYARAARERFAGREDHAAVRRFGELAEEGLSYIDAMELALSLGEAPGFEVVLEPMYHVVERFGGEASLGAFLRDLRDFSGGELFAGLWRDTEDFRAGTRATLEKQAAKLPLQARLEAYTGIPVRCALTVIPSPFANRVDAVTLTRQGAITVVIGPLRVSGGRQRFDLRLRAGDFWRRLAYEQLRGAADMYKEEIAASEHLFAPIRDVCESWFEAVRVHVSFAVAQRLLVDHNPDLAEEYPIKYAKIGYPYIVPLCKALQEYEKDRAKYPALRGFYPRLLEALAAYDAPHLPFRGTIGDVLDGRDIILIAPAQWRKAALALRDAHWPSGDVASDRDALSKKLIGRTVIALGDAAENAWLAAHPPALPLKFTPGRLELSRRRRPFFSVEGEVGLVTVAQNPEDERRGMLWLAGAAAARPLGKLPPRVDFVVSRGGERVKTGFYDKTRRWDIQ